MGEEEGDEEDGVGRYNILSFVSGHCLEDGVWLLWIICFVAYGYGLRYTVYGVRTIYDIPRPSWELEHFWGNIGRTQGV